MIDGHKKLEYMIWMHNQRELLSFLSEKKHYYNPYIRDFPIETYLSGLLKDISNLENYSETELEIKNFVEMAVEAEKQEIKIAQEVIRKPIEQSVKLELQERGIEKIRKSLLS